MSRISPKVILVGRSVAYDSADRARSEDAKDFVFKGQAANYGGLSIVKSFDYLCPLQFTAEQYFASLAY